MDAPRISVILPVHQNASTLVAAIASCLRQTEPAFELIIVLNGSDEPTRAAAGAFADGRIQVAELAQPSLVDACNHGLALARGELIARMDADDLMHKRRLELQSQLLLSRPDLDVVGCCVRFSSELAWSDGLRRYVKWQNTLLTPEQIRANRFVESPLVHPTLMMRQEKLLALGGYRSGDFPEDYDLLLRMLERGTKMAKVPKQLLVWRDHATRLTRNDPRYSESAFHRLKAPYLAAHLRARGVLPGARPLWIWGTGPVARRNSPLLLALGFEVSGYIEINPRKIGGTKSGAPIVSPDQIPRAASFSPSERPYIVSYVAGLKARSLITAQLIQKGYALDLDFSCVA